MGKPKGAKDKKKRKSYARPPCSEEKKAKIKATWDKKRADKLEAERIDKMDIRERLAEDLFGRQT